MSRLRWPATLLLFLVAACPATVSKGGEDCTQSGECPKGLRCFADWHCYPEDADPACTPPCYGAEPYCHKGTLRCVACLGTRDCGAGEVCVLPALRCQPGCNAQHPTCATAAERCDLALGVCRGCNADAECTTAASPHCDLTSGRCVRCAVDADCPADSYCDGSAGEQACVPGCRTRSDCDNDAGPNTECCAHRCVDTATSPQHCGGCGTTCGGKTCCAGACADLATDVDHCGSCARSCALPNVATPKCLASTCSDQGCEFYFGDCDANPANGCEANLSYDANHCSACYRPCTPRPHAAPACILTSCGLGACLPGWANCNQDPSDGCEVDTTVDAQHCGSCIKACGAPSVCVAGQCS